MFTIQLNDIFFITTISHVYIFCGSHPLIGQNVREAEPNEFDFVASVSVKNFHNIIEDEKNHLCGGVLISQRFVLTSAHCKNLALNRSDIVVAKVGSIDLRNSEIYEIEDWITFVEYKENQEMESFLHEDISVIELKESVDPRIEPAKIAVFHSDYDLVDKTAVTAGWGETNDGVKDPRYMMTATLKVISYEDCIRNMNEADMYNREYSLNIGQICTNADPYVVLGCGDSGSPLLLNGTELVGINDSRCPSQGEQYLSLEQNRHVKLDYYLFFINDVVDRNISYFRSNSRSQQPCKKIKLNTK